MYVLVFKKKSKKDIATPAPDLELIRVRLRGAAVHYRLHYAFTGNDDE